VRTQAFSCGCFVKVHVCESCFGLAGTQLQIEIEGLRDQLDLGILDTRVSVSAMDGTGHG